ncbi:MAG: ferrous iron transport protein B [Planctomycetaceae bacterium]
MTVPPRLTVALLGNPNTGKSTLFNALSGARALTGNYPGVTVEKKIGKTTFGDRPVDLVDLPGTYSLAPRSLDEMVAVDVLLGRLPDLPRPDVVICIVDASNLERNLYLAGQLLGLGRPLVLVLNMADVAEQRGVTIDDAALARQLGVPVVRTQAHRRLGLDSLKQAVLQVAGEGRREPPAIFPEAFQHEVARATRWLPATTTTRQPEHHPGPGDNAPQAVSATQAARLGPEQRFLGERLLLDVGGWLEQQAVRSGGAEVATELRQARERLAAAGMPVPVSEARLRYGWIREQLRGVASRPATRPTTFSDRLDRLLTHHIAGLLIFALLMLLIFQALYRGAQPLMDLCEQAQGVVQGWVAQWIPPGPLQSLVSDGIVGGVGSVLVFLPQIVILFLFIALLEDCGYLARAAFIMDRLMTRVGLSGKSFVPLMSSFACAVPGILSTRVIENRRDRLTTILVAPLMSCSARQPVYALMIAAFLPATYWFNGWLGLRELTLLAMTSLGALVAVPVAWLLKKTFFKGETPPFVMELPTYKWPSLRLVLTRVYDQARAFVVRAGTLIFATNVLVWGAGYFPQDHSVANARQAELDQLAETLAEPLARREALRQQLEESEAADPAEPGTNPARQELAELDATLAEHDRQAGALNALRADLLEQSYLGRAGKAIEPVVRPLGWDWRIGVGVLASFPAREVVVGTLGTIYSLGSDEQGLPAALRASTWPDGRPVFTLGVALSVMVFFALCAQCVSTLMVIHREAGDWRWALFAFVYMTALAYVGALVVYRATAWLWPAA